MKYQFVRSLFFIALLVPHICIADSSVRDDYINSVKGFSLCGNALMPWGNNAWAPDKAEKPYVEQAKLNQIKMKSDVDAEFYTVANLERIFTSLTSKFFEDTADIVAQLKLLPSDVHEGIWRELFEIEKEARLVREKLQSDFKLHAEIIKLCAVDLSHS